MRTLGVFLLIAGMGMADTLTLRDGRTLSGNYLGGDARAVRFAVGDRVDTFNLEKISSITFDGSAQSPIAQAYSQPGAGGPELASGTALVVRMIDSVDSERDAVGKEFRASLDEPVMDRNGNTVLPRGADVIVKLVDDKQSGKLAGRTVLTLSLRSVNINGRPIEINTMNVTEQSSSRTARSGKVIGGAAAAGAIIGAIAGGGKGAAIGAGAGAGAGTVAEVATKGQRVRIPSETRLTFTLQQSVRL